MEKSINQVDFTVCHMNNNQQIFEIRHVQIYEKSRSKDIRLQFHKRVLRMVGKVGGLQKPIFTANFWNQRVVELSFA